jgi:glutaredoxin
MTTEAVHYYWRPGCPFCSMLRRGLDKAGVETVDHNIWESPEAAATVRFHAGGNETVPTVVIGEVGMVNPSAGQVARHLQRFASHLLPEGFETPQPGLIGRLLGG